MSDLADRVFRPCSATISCSGGLPPRRTALGDGPLRERYGVSRTPVSRKRWPDCSPTASSSGRGARASIPTGRACRIWTASTNSGPTGGNCAGIVRIEEDDDRSHDHDVLGPELDRWQALRRLVPQVPTPASSPRTNGFHVQPAVIGQAIRPWWPRLELVKRADPPGADVRLPHRGPHAGPRSPEHIQVAERILDGDLVRGQASPDGAHRRIAQTSRSTGPGRALSMAGIVMALRT